MIQTAWMVLNKSKCHMTIETAQTLQMTNTITIKVIFPKVTIQMNLVILFSLNRQVTLRFIYGLFDKDLTFWEKKLKYLADICRHLF